MSGHQDMVPLPGGIFLGEIIESDFGYLAVSPGHLLSTSGTVKSRKRLKRIAWTL